MLYRIAIQFHYQIIDRGEVVYYRPLVTHFDCALSSPFHVDESDRVSCIIHSMMFVEQMGLNYILALFFDFTTS